MDYSNLFVCLMGMGTVFVGLVCIVVLVIGMSAICRKLGHIEEAVTPTAAPVAAAPVNPQPAANQGALMAAIAAAIAEDMGPTFPLSALSLLKKCNHRRNKKNEEVQSER